MAEPADNPESADPDKSDDLLDEFKKRIKNARQARRAWADSSRAYYDIYNGRQWANEDAEKLKEEGRPAVTFNRVAPPIDAIVGTAINNRQMTVIKPRTVGGQAIADDDNRVSEACSETIRYVEDSSNSCDEEDQAFKDELITGMGWTDTRIEMERDPDGKILVEWVSPFEMFWDPDAKKRNLEDAKWLSHMQLYSKEEVEQIWPDAVEKMTGLASAAINDKEMGSEPHNADFNWKYENNYSDFELRRRNFYRVFEYQWWKREPYFRWNNPDTPQTQLDDLSPEDHSKLVDRTKQLLEAHMASAPDPSLTATPEGAQMAQEHQAKGAQLSDLGNRLSEAKKFFRRIYYRAFIGGDGLVLLEDQQPCPGGDDFTFQAMTGKRDVTRNEFYGIVKAMKDPQDWANKFFSLYMDIIATAAKGGPMVETDAVKNVQRFEDQWSKTGAVKWLEAGGIEKVKEPMQVPPQPAISEVMGVAIDAIQKTTGINVEVIGYGAGANTPGVTVSSRIRQGFAILSDYFAARSLYKRRQARVMLNMIKDYLPTQQILRIIGSQYADVVAQIKDGSTFKYDVIIDESPDSPNLKEQTWATVMQLMPMFIQGGVPPQMIGQVMQAVAPYSPLPVSLTGALVQAFSSLQPGAQVSPGPTPAAPHGPPQPNGRPPEQPGTPQMH